MSVAAFLICLHVVVISPDRQTLKILAEVVDLKDAVCICSMLVTVTSILIHTVSLVWYCR